MWIVFLLLAVAPAGPLDLAQVKMKQIEAGHVAPGASVAFSAAELEAVARQEAAGYGQSAIHHVRLNLWPAHAGITAQVDLVRLAQLRGRPMHPLLARLLSGERQINAVLRLETVRGHALVDLESLEVDGNVLEGRPLDLLIHQFVTNEFPDARLDQWFAMDYNIDTITLWRGQAVVNLRARR